jgi:hypothetical protein
MYQDNTSATESTIQPFQAQPAQGPWAQTEPFAHGFPQSFMQEQFIHDPYLRDYYVHDHYVHAYTPYGYDPYHDWHHYSHQYDPYYAYAQPYSYPMVHQQSYPSYPTPYVVVT